MRYLPRIAAMLIKDVVYIGAAKKPTTVPAGTKVSIVKLPAHEETDATTGKTEQVPSGATAALHEGTWFDVVPGEFSVDC